MCASEQRVSSSTSCLLRSLLLSQRVSKHALLNAACSWLRLTHAAGAQITSLRWNTWGSQLYLQSEESSIQIYTFYSPKKPARPSMSHRLLGAAASALSVPRPE